MSAGKNRIQFRVGVVRAGIVEEHNLKSGDRFCKEDVELIAGSRSLQLVCHETQEGRLEFSGFSGSPAEAVTARKAKYQGRRLVLELGPGSRAKLVGSESIVLVQVLGAGTASSNWDEDYLFEGLLGVFSASAMVLCVWLQYFAVPMQDELDIEEATVLVARLPLPPPQLIETAPSPNKTSEPTPAANPSHSSLPSPNPPSKSSGHLLRDAVARLDPKELGLGELALTPDLQAIPKAIGTTGEPTTGFRVQTVELEDTQVNLPPTPGGCTQPSGCLSARPTETVKLNLQPQVTADAQPEIPDELPTDDMALVASVIKRSAGGVEACTGSSLARNPATKGKLTARWMISNGVVRGEQLIHNSTGDEELGKCVLRVVKRMKFGEEVSAEVGSYSWVVGAK
jgi:hypothetical protein